MILFLPLGQGLGHSRKLFHSRFFSVLWGTEWDIRKFDELQLYAVCIKDLSGHWLFSQEKKRGERGATKARWEPSDKHRISPKFPHYYRKKDVNQVFRLHKTSSLYQESHNSTSVLDIQARLTCISASPRTKTSAALSQKLPTAQKTKKNFVYIKTANWGKVGERLQISQNKQKEYFFLFRNFSSDFH